MNIAYLQSLVAMGITAFLPIIITSIAGVLRQDGLSDKENEVISYAVVIVVGAMQAFAGGVLGVSPLADFMLVCAYSQAAMHSPLLQSLQKYLQSNVLSVVKTPEMDKPVDTTPVLDHNAIIQTAFDLMKKNAPAMASLMARELAKRASVQVAPSDTADGKAITQKLADKQPAS